MADNVLILGAGFSYDAGIPLLGGVVERMWEYAIRGTSNGEPLSSEDVRVFEEAIRVRNELDGYHGRARFDDRNIEDILSILSFNAMSGKRRERRKLEAMNRALARTIELSCTVTHPGVDERRIVALRKGPEPYREFWVNLLNLLDSGRSLPTIITFNYDLVLERSLLQVLINTAYYNGLNKRVPFTSFRMRYYHDTVADQAFGVRYVSYDDMKEFRQVPGTKLVSVDPSKERDLRDIEVLKLHGSLNFPEKQAADNGRQFNIADSVDLPYILPPIFNKLSSGRSAGAWTVAMQRLRSSKNVVVVGYSLPRTDIYMQYFLKAALGPNLDLNRIIVFDPVLFQSGGRRADMEKRYLECFSSQLANRITFQPEYATLTGSDTGVPGSMRHFVQSVRQRPDSIFF